MCFSDRWLFSSSTVIFSKSHFLVSPMLIPNKSATEHFTNLVDDFNNSIENNNQQTQTLSTLRDTLLPKLISGELRVGEGEEVVGNVL